ncbi:MAG: tripartite tricarboxylate transporter substrate binding protein [Hyphomicrobiaceae bacterium]
MTIRKLGVKFVIATAAATIVASSAALAAFPEKPIKLVVGFRAGGGTDALATALGKEMEAILGQPIVKEIRAGAGGGKAAASVKTAKPDGYTLVMAVTPTFAFNPAYAPKKTPYTKDDFDYIESLAKAQEGIFAKSGGPFKTWAEMIAYAKKGNTLTYASVTPFDRLLVKAINKKDGITIKAVPVKGGSGAVKNVLGGHTSMGFTGGAHIKHMSKGTVVLLASLRTERLTGTPDVPTLMELGYPLSFEAHFMIAAPKGVPADVKKTLVDAIRKASKGPAVRQILKKLPFAEEQLGPEGLTELIDKASKSYTDVISANK